MVGAAGREGQKADVGPLMDDLVAWIAEASRGGLHPLVVAAVAHAEFINIHPFDDGNGRTVWVSLYTWYD